MEKKKLSGSITMKIAVFFLMAISVIVGILMFFTTLYLMGYDAYGGSQDAWVREMIQPLSQEDYNYLKMRFEYEEESVMTEYCRKHNISVSIIDDKGKTAFERMEGAQEDYPYEFYYYFSFYKEEVVEDYDIMVAPEYFSDEVYDFIDLEKSKVLQYQSSVSEAQEAQDIQEEADALKKVEVTQVLHNYSMQIYVNPQQAGGKYAERYEMAQKVYELRYMFPIVMTICILTVIICFLFLMCAAGHRNGREGIIPSVLENIPLEVLFGVVLLLSFLLLFFVSAFGFSDFAITCMASVGNAVEGVIVTLFCMEVANRLKRGECLRQTLICHLLRWCGRGICSLFGALCKIPLVWKVMTGYLVISLLEFMGVLIFCEAEVFVLWATEKAILFVLLLYVSLACKKLQKGSEELAAGNMNYHMDTSKLLLDFKEHGENLNSIGQGIVKAVEDRMRSERLKTELITNVSHDLKTPLTSIINYADLLGTEKLTAEQVSEYSEVLLRQSKRLKKLLEDLLEASKATTGNLEVNLQPCEISVILSQAVGEYEPRFTEKQLELLIQQPENPITIMADGRHLWRVFDNLLNNIYKYAQEGSRVYINVEQGDGKVQILFRNMSKYALNISAEELEERFVRGDTSRHLEGNGLGLSIAKSLTDLQQGKLSIYVDGDLFKAGLSFPLLQE